MKRTITTLALSALLTMVVAGPAFAGMLACPPSPSPGSTLECGVSNAEPEATVGWEATFADDTEETGEVQTDAEGSGGLAVAIPDDPELAGTQFTITLEDGGSYTGMIGEPEPDAEAAADDADAMDAEADADDDTEVQGQVEQQPDADSEVGLGAGGAAGVPGLALLVGALAVVLVLGGGVQLVRAGRR